MSNDQSAALTEANKAVAAWVDNGERLNRAYLNQQNISRLQMAGMLARRYPTLIARDYRIVEEKVFKGEVILVVEYQRRGMYRFGGHNYWVKAYAAHRNGTWMIFQKLSDIH